MRFNSQVKNCGSFPTVYSKEDISNEPMFYRASSDFAWTHGGKITRKFLEAIPLDDWYCEDVTIDSRVHMLMPGWYPCIPGMHHDDIPRTRRDGQPDYKNPGYNATHLIGLVNAEIAPTEFALGGRLTWRFHQKVN